MNPMYDLFDRVGRQVTEDLERLVEAQLAGLCDEDVPADLRDYYVSLCRYNDRVELKRYD